MFVVYFVNFLLLHMCFVIVTRWGGSFDP